MNLRLQRYFKEWKTLSLLHKVQLPERVGEVAVPTLAMNRVYLLVHIYRHLFDEGIGLRQLLDYHFVLRQPCSEAEREEAVRCLERLHLKRFAGAVMYVLQTVFGPFGRFRRKVSRNMGFLTDYPGEVLWSPLFKIWHYAWRSRHGYLPPKK